MNDYLIDPKLIREFKEITQPYSAKDPTPYPEKGKRIPPTLNSMQVSTNATKKKEVIELEHKYKNLEKAYNKILKKNTDIQEELKVLKAANDSTSRDLNILQITNEKIMTEKLNAESLLDENRAYTRKLESRLVQGAKNQYLIEINNKLRKEIDDLKSSFAEKLNQAESTRCEINKKNQEIKILHKALEIKTDDVKYKGDLKSSLLYDVGTIKQEMDEVSENLKVKNEQNKQLKLDLEDKMEKIQELHFTKAHLTEHLVDCENKIHNLEIEKESFERHCNELKEERSIFREYVEKISDDYKTASESNKKENKDLNFKIKEMEKSIINKDEIIKKLNVEIENLKYSINQLIDKNKSLDTYFKSKSDELTQLESNVKCQEKEIKLLQDNNYELEQENHTLHKTVTAINKQLSELEKENMEIIKKNKTLTISQENFQSDLMKQNQHLNTVESKLKEQIQKYISDIENIKNEKENLKQIMNESITKCSMLIKEKSDLESDINKKNAQIESLKNTNILLHKNFSMKIEKNQPLKEEEKIIKIGKAKIEETNVINLIRREKEKNKEFLEEIKKLKSNINNY